MSWRLEAKQELVLRAEPLVESLIIKKEHVNDPSEMENIASVLVGYESICFQDRHLITSDGWSAKKKIYYYYY